MGIFTPDDKPEAALAAPEEQAPEAPTAEAETAAPDEDASSDLGEFDSVEQRDAYIAGLEAELAGQKQRAETPEAGEVHVEAAERRIPAIAAELERVKRTRLRGDAR